MKKYNIEQNTIQIEAFAEPLTQEDVKIIEEKATILMNTFDKINFMITLGVHEKVSLKAQLETLRFAFKTWKRIHKIAVIGNSNKEHVLVTMNNAFVPWKEKYFDIDDLAKAYSWLKD